ncbi:hypothetical protein [Ktedonobacter sp. SOSP1-85]|nr:hypothetical protein [Ktedonobacter sp. SOSP1-85]
MTCILSTKSAKTEDTTLAPEPVPELLINTPAIGVGILQAISDV